MLDGWDFLYQFALPFSRDRAVGADCGDHAGMPDVLRKCLEGFAGGVGGVSPLHQRFTKCVGSEVKVSRLSLRSFGHQDLR